MLSSAGGNGSVTLQEYMQRPSSSTARRPLDAGRLPPLSMRPCSGTNTFKSCFECGQAVQSTVHLPTVLGGWFPCYHSTRAP